MLVSKSFSDLQHLLISGESLSLKYDVVRSALTLHTQETEISTRIVLTDCPQFVPDEIDEKKFGVVIFEMLNSK